MSEHPGRLERATESTLAKAFTRFVVPIMVAIIGWFLIDAVGRVEKTQGRVEKAQEKQGDDIVQIKSDVRDVNTRLDAQVIRQVDANTHNIEKLDDRVQTLERTVKTP